MPSPSSFRVRSATLIAAVAIAASSVGVSSLRAEPRRATGEAYPIRLERPVAPGARWRLTIDGEKHEHLEQRVGGRWQTLEDSDEFVTMRAVEQVLTVNASGDPLASEFTVEAFELRRGETRTTPIAPSTVLRLVRATAPGTEPTWTIGSAPASPEIVEALSIAITGKVSDTDEDQFFGSTTPRRVGERWSIAADLAERDLARTAEIGVDLRGDVRVLELVTLDAMPCLVIGATMTGRVTSIPRLPPGATLSRGAFTASHRGAYPTDGTSVTRSNDFEMSLDATVSVPAAQGGRPTTIRMRFGQIRHDTRSIVR